MHVVLAEAGVGEAELLEHVGADAVGAEHHRVATRRRRGRSRRALFMFERGLWTMVPGQVAVEVDAVHEQPVVGGQVLEPGAGVAVDGPFGHVDVHADAEIGGQPGGGRRACRRGT